MASCLALTQKKKRCKNLGLYNGYCHVHRRDTDIIPSDSQTYTHATRQIYTPNYESIQIQTYTPSYTSINNSNIKDEPKFIDPNIQINPVTGNKQHAFDLFNINKYNLFNNRDSTNLLAMNKSSYERRKEIVVNRFVTYDELITSCPTGINCPRMTKVIITGKNQLENLPNTVRELKFNVRSHLGVYVYIIPNFITHVDLIGLPYHEFILTDSVTHLKLPDTFNDDIILPKNLTHLKFGEEYNQKTVLPESLLYLDFGLDYNQVTRLSSNLKYVSFGLFYNQITNIPESVTHIVFGNYYNQLTMLPKSIIGVKLRSGSLVSPLPESLVYLSLPGGAINIQGIINNKSIKYLAIDIHLYEIYPNGTDRFIFYQFDDTFSSFVEKPDNPNLSDIDVVLQQRKCYLEFNNQFILEWIDEIDVVGLGESYIYSSRTDTLLFSESSSDNEKSDVEENVNREDEN
jgi:hypothetical protein